jgi:RNA polymerase sigma-70 factor (ECF subfamily)
MRDGQRQEAEMIRHMAGLMGAARRLARPPDAAEDLVQETALRVWRRLAAGAEVEDPRAYLFAVLRDVARAPRRRAEALGEADMPCVVPDAERRLAAAAVLRALDGLPEEQRVLLRAVAFEGASYAGLARRHGLPVGTVTSRVARGRARLAARLGVPREAAVRALLGE